VVTVLKVVTCFSMVLVLVYVHYSMHAVYIVL
jgi:hypothetical protein